MRIIGIDPGLASTGFGIIETVGNKIRYVAHGVIKTSPEKPLGERLFHIYQDLNQVIDMYKPEEGGIEALFFAKNITSALPVAHAKGVVHLVFAQHGIPLGEYTPIVIKRAVVGEGRAEKGQVQEMVKVILNLDKVPRPDHAADALSAAICHVNNRSFANV